MPDLTTLSNHCDSDKRECRVIIETPKTGRNKFKYDPDTNLFTLSGLLPEGMSFPFDFGFVPSTVGQDGDPLDVMVLMDEPAHVGCLLDVRIIGVIEAEQTEKSGKTERNDRLLAVAAHSYSHEDIKSIDEIQISLLEQIEDFFINYNKARGKKFKVKHCGGPKRAMEVLEQGMKAFKRQRAA